MKIVIFGGTSEGRELSNELAKAGAEVLVSVASDYGAEEQGTADGVTVARGQEASIVFDLFNAFNSTNWGCYDTTIIPTADQATDAGWRRNFGQPRCAGLGRRLQIGLRYGYRGAGESSDGNGGR